MAEDAWDEEDKCTHEEKKLEALLDGAEIGTNPTFAEEAPDAEEARERDLLTAEQEAEKL